MKLSAISAITEHKSSAISAIIPKKQLERVRITALSILLDEIDRKRRSELIRFRTCCADPRASK
jgi:hypothetical protein